MPITEQLVGTLLRESFHLRSGNHDPTVGEALLLAYLIVGPGCRIKLWQDVSPTSVRFREHGHEYKREEPDHTAECGHPGEIWLFQPALVVFA
jgi:hypothetical protein